MSMWLILLFLVGMAHAQFNFKELDELLPERAQAGAKNIHELQPDVYIGRLKKLIPRIRESRPVFQANIHSWNKNFENLNPGKKAGPLNDLPAPKMKQLRGILQRYVCPMALPTGASDCEGSASPNKYVMLTNDEKALLLPLGFTNAELDAAQSDESRIKFKHLMYNVDFRVQEKMLGYKELEAQALINKYDQQKQAIATKEKDIQSACAPYLKSVSGKIPSPVAGRTSSSMPTTITSVQVAPYIEGIHREHTLATQIENTAERIERFKKLRQAAEVLVCNGHRSAMAEMIPRLENNLLEAAHTGNTDCSQAGSSDLDFQDKSKCFAQFLDSFPSAFGEFVTDTQTFNKHTKGLTSKGILEQIKKDQLKQANDNMVYVNAIYNLDPKYPIVALPKSVPRSSDCGGSELQNVQNQYAHFIRQMAESNQYSSMNKDARIAAISDQTARYIENIAASHPKVGALLYSPAFLSSANIDLESMEFKEQAVDCAAIKTSMKETLQDSIRNIYSPPDHKMDRNIAQASQLTKKFLSDALIPAPIGTYLLDQSNYDDINELYKEIPELRSYKPEEIHHLKSLLRYRPEMREHYIRQFEGNSRLICLLFKATAKDHIRDQVVQKEVKFVKGVAKAVGSAVTIGSYFVNPALGFVLTAAAAGATGAYHTINITNLQSQLDEVKLREGVVLNDCIENMMRSPSSDKSLAQRQCADAVASAQQINAIAEDLVKANKAARNDAILYATYMVSLYPQMTHHLHDIHEGKKTASIMSDSFNKAREAFNAAPKGGGNALKDMARAFAKEEWHHYAHNALGAAYGLSKSYKLGYYMLQAKYSSYMVKYNSAAKVGYHHVEVEEKAKARAHKLGRALTDKEFNAIDLEVHHHIEKMSEKEVMNQINGTMKIASAH